MTITCKNIWDWKKYSEKILHERTFIYCRFILVNELQPFILFFFLLIIFTIIFLYVTNFMGKNNKSDIFNKMYDETKHWE